jgi:hypothetical protein
MSTVITAIMSNKQQRHMVGTLLKQVIDAHSDHLPDGVVDSLKQKRRKNNGGLSLEESCQFLESTFQSFSRFYICIDALDECLDEHRKAFLHSIASLLQRYGNKARIFTTGRPHMKASIEKLFPVPPCEVVIEANEDDIRRFVSLKLEMDDNFADIDMKDPDSFKKEIMDRIIETANGM